VTQNHRKQPYVQDPTETRDERHGAYDPAGAAGMPVREDKIREQTTPHQRDQQGADVRGDPVVRDAVEPPVPEGLRRAPRGPVGPTTGVDRKKQG